MRVSTRNTAQTILQLFLDIIKVFGCPYQVQGDRGSENVDLCTWIIMYCGPNRASFMWGTWVSICYHSHILKSNPMPIALRIILRSRGCGSKQVTTLPAAGRPSLPTLRGFTASIGTIPTTSGSLPPLPQRYPERMCEVPDGLELSLHIRKERNMSPEVHTKCQSPNSAYCPILNRSSGCWARPF